MILEGGRTGVRLEEEGCYMLECFVLIISVADLAFFFFSFIVPFFLNA